MSQSVWPDHAGNKDTRQVFVLTGHRQDIINGLRGFISPDQPGALIVSPDDALYQGLPVCRCQQATDLLGQEKSVVFVDCFTELCVDAIAAVAGLIVGGGCLVFCMPEKKYWSVTYSTLFAKRFSQYIDDFQQARWLSVKQPDISRLLQPFVLIERKTEPMQPTADQLTVIEKSKELLTNHEKSALVVISDRGRGKSSALGMLAAELMPGVSRILITAPSFKATEQSFYHAKRRLNIKKFSHAVLETGNAQFCFAAPDELLERLPDAELVLVDEAAAIPLPMLKRICQYYPRTIFATTVHGYEGTGRGFFIRFFQLLDEMTRWEKIEMKQPVRWSALDELEPWLFKLLCLDADVPLLASDVNLERVKIRAIRAEQLSDNESLLREVFALLVLAHYRTRPSDLKRLLDDDVDILVAEHESVIVGVILSMREGGFSSELSRQIYNGERRPQGNLLAQTLCYHCGVEQAASLSVQRIMRLVVHPALQGRGIGSRLLTALVNRLQGKVELLGASFGLTAELAAFWQQNKFNLLRIGFRKEQSSGEHAGVFVRPLTELGNRVAGQCRDRLYSHWPFLQKTVLRDIDDRLVGFPEGDLDTSASDRQDIESFVTTARSYELCIAGVNHWLQENRQAIEQLPDVSSEIIDLVTRDTLDWKEVARQLNLAGKKQAQEMFKNAVIYCWKAITPR